MITPARDTGTTIRKRSVILQGHRTAVSVEDEFWAELLQIAAARGISTNRLVSEIDGCRANHGNLSSSIRLYVLAAVQRRCIASAA